MDITYYKLEYLISGTRCPLSRVTLDQLNDFIARCAHIDTVIIDLTYFAGLKNGSLKLAVNKLLYPNVTLVPPVGYEDSVDGNVSESSNPAAAAAAAALQFPAAAAL